MSMNDIPLVSALPMYMTIKILKSKLYHFKRISAPIYMIYDNQ